MGPGGGWGGGVKEEGHHHVTPIILAEAARQFSLENSSCGYLPPHPSPPPPPLPLPPPSPSNAHSLHPRRGEISLSRLRVVRALQLIPCVVFDIVMCHDLLFFIRCFICCSLCRSLSCRLRRSANLVHRICHRTIPLFFCCVCVCVYIPLCAT